MERGVTPQTDVVLKLLLIGDMGVGKSSLLLRYIDNDFSATYISTIGVDFKVKTIMVGGLRVKLQIWDTAGQDRFRTITSTWVSLFTCFIVSLPIDSYYRGAHGIIIVYDVNDVRTFCNVERWTQEASMYTDDSIARILVGNKNDTPALKTVAAHDAQRLAAKHSCLFIETSAKSDENVDQMFDMITREALRLRLQLASQQCNAMPNSITLRPVAAAPPEKRRNCCK
ncbi:Ras-related protein Rab-35 [Clonorchis sinensis]|uniref:Ras-related protein Rab-35 n=1 Tax=Clonorchis sinensis TaxID=79923 RepID=G7Y8S9_CLOSI|nr:Ras-related protein Rab-35 [Clonorchis sinensis]